MKKIFTLFIFLAIPSFFTLGIYSTVSANGVAPENTVLQENEQPDLPQTQEEAEQKEATQQISSPQFYDETSQQSFIKGIGAGFAIGVIIGGVIVWFFKKKII